MNLTTYNALLTPSNIQSQPLQPPACSTEVNSESRWQGRLEAVWGWSLHITRYLVTPYQTHLVGVGMQAPAGACSGDRSLHAAACMTCWTQAARAVTYKAQALLTGQCSVQRVQMTTTV